MEFGACLINYHGEKTAEIQSGVYFVFPLDEQDVIEKIGESPVGYYVFDVESVPDLHDGYEGYMTISEINQMLSLEMQIIGTVFERDARDILERFFTDLKEFVEHLKEIHYYPGDTLEDVVRSRLEQGMYGDISDKMMAYLDLEAMGRELEREKNILIGAHGVYEYP